MHPYFNIESIQHRFNTTVHKIFLPNSTSQLHPRPHTICRLLLIMTRVYSWIDQIFVDGSQPPLAISNKSPYQRTKPPDEFRLRQIKQIMKHGRSMVDITRRLGVSTHSLYKWINLQQIPAVQRFKQASQSEERRRLKAELKRVTEESYILKNGCVLRSSVRLWHLTSWCNNPTSVHQINLRWLTSSTSARRRITVSGDGDRLLLPPSGWLDNW